jgi:hypothetical protein
MQNRSPSSCESASWWERELGVFAAREGWLCVSARRFNAVPMSAGKTTQQVQSQDSFNVRWNGKNAIQ